MEVALLLRPRTAAPASSLLHLLSRGEKSMAAPPRVLPELLLAQKDDLFLQQVAQGVDDSDDGMWRGFFS